MAEPARQRQVSRQRPGPGAFQELATTPAPDAALSLRRAREVLGPTPRGRRGWSASAFTHLAFAHLALTITLLGPAAAGGDTGPGFEVLGASSRLERGVVLLDAEIDFRFSDDAREAMRNGVPLTVSVEMQVLRARRGPDKRVAFIRARYRISTHALSNQYLVTNVSSGEASTYGSFEEMRAALGRIERFPVVDETLLVPPDARFRGRVRARLDIEALPAPMRPLAYVSPSWRLKSEWYPWPVDL